MVDEGGDEASANFSEMMNRCLTGARRLGCVGPTLCLYFAVAKLRGLLVTG